MKTSFYFVFLSMITFSFCSCYAQKQESNSPPLRTDEFIVGDTIYLDTLIIDNKIDEFDSKEYNFKANVDRVPFRQIVHNITNDTIEIRARGDLTSCWNKGKIKPNEYAVFYYGWYMTGKSGPIMIETAIRYNVANSTDNNYKRIWVILHGRKE